MNSNLDPTSEGLEGSIKKWEGIVADTEVDLGAQNCPLCQVFIDKVCQGCPVQERTNETFCFSTPYVHYRDLSERLRCKTKTRKRNYELHPELKELDRALVSAAQAELDFLKSLRKVPNEF